VFLPSHQLAKGHKNLRMLIPSSFNCQCTKQETPQPLFPLAEMACSSRMERAQSTACRLLKHSRYSYSLVHRYYYSRNGYMKVLAEHLSLLIATGLFRLLFGAGLSRVFAPIYFPFIPFKTFIPQLYYRVLLNTISDTPVTYFCHLLHHSITS
jgi:hypothetical protein